MEWMQFLYCWTDELFWFCEGIWYFGIIKISIKIQLIYSYLQNLNIRAQNNFKIILMIARREVKFCLISVQKQRLWKKQPIFVFSQTQQRRVSGDLPRYTTIIVIFCLSRRKINLYLPYSQSLFYVLQIGLLFSWQH